MKTIDNSASIIVINKSRFICELIYLNSLDEVQTNLNLIKDKYKGATHYCYSYIFDNVKRFSDDGEPSGTAGMPILNVLENNNLNHVLCIVIRYFGGIKLGAGGLVRAYTKAVTNCLENTKQFNLIKAKLIKIEFSYDKEKIANSIIKNNIVSKEFNKNIIYTINVCEEDLNIILKQLKNIIIKYKILDDTYIKKSV